MDLGGLAAGERVLDDSVRSFLTDVPKLLPLLENLFTGPCVDCKGNEYDEPTAKSVWSNMASEQYRSAVPDRPVEHRYSEEVPLDGYPTPQLPKTISQPWPLPDDECLPWPVRRSCPSTGLQLGGTQWPESTASRNRARNISIPALATDPR